MPSTRREALIERFGVTPPVATLVRTELAAAIAGAESRAVDSQQRVRVLDAGCGRRSQLRQFRSRIGWLVGADLHRSASPAMPFDAFVEVDLCGADDAFAPGSFDLILASFAIEHLAEPRAALTNMHTWLVPGGRLVATTVNRRHPFVAGYLDLPSWLRRRAQRVVKRAEVDVHRLVGACNDPAAVRSALDAAGFQEIHTTTVGNLARAWGSTWPTFAIGLIGDVLAQRFPSRRSTIVTVATA